MSDYENQRRAAHQRAAYSPGGSGKLTYWLLGIAAVFVLSILVFAGGGTEPVDGSGQAPATSAIPDAPAVPEAPEPSAVAPQ